MSLMRRSRSKLNVTAKLRFPDDVAKQEVYIKMHLDASERYDDAVYMITTDQFFDLKKKVRQQFGKRPRISAEQGIVLGGGVGTELKALLGRLGIKSSANCKCNARARTMNERGIAWCEGSTFQIVDWLQEEADNRGLPFNRLAGVVVVKLAIRRAKKKENANA